RASYGGICRGLSGKFSSSRFDRDPATDYGITMEMYNNPINKRDYLDVITRANKTLELNREARNRADAYLAETAMSPTVKGPVEPMNEQALARGSDPKYLEAARACVRDGELLVVQDYFLETGLVTIE